MWLFSYRKDLEINIGLKQKYCVDCKFLWISLLFCLNNMHQFILSHINVCEYHKLRHFIQSILNIDQSFMWTYIYIYPQCYFVFPFSNYWKLSLINKFLIHTKQDFCKVYWVLRYLWVRVFKFSVSKILSNYFKKQGFD